MRAIVNLIMSSIAFRAPKIALLSGSLRKGSFNTKLIGAAEQVAAKLGAETSVIDLGAYDLPIYNQDDEADDYPQAAMDLKAVLGEQADGWVVSSPEYNGWISPLLLNAYTWCSRGDPAGGPMYATFAGKSAVVLSSSPGAMGGLRTLNPHRQLLNNLGVNVLPQSVAIGAAYKPLMRMAFWWMKSNKICCRQLSRPCTTKLAIKQTAKRLASLSKNQ